MKTDFSILWVDDNKDFVESLRTPLEKWMDEEYGFKLVIHRYPGENGISECLGNNDIELIVLDYKLRGKKKGDSIISDIRTQKCYEDIIFYTTDSLPNKIFKESPDGVFFANRSEAKERIKTLSSSKIIKTSDLATLRGWIVADSIELEAILLRIIKRYHGNYKEILQDKVISALCRDGTFFFGRLKDFIREILKERYEHLIFSEDAIFDFGGKHSILCGLVNEHIKHLRVEGGKANVELSIKMDPIKTILNSFPSEIIVIRNALAHQMAEITPTGGKRIKTKTKEAKEIEITQKECAKIRRNFRKHLENLLALEELV